MNIVNPILVTGGAGFIGSGIANKLIGLGHTVVIIDNLSTGYLDKLPKKSIFIEGDCASQDVIDQLQPYQFEAIFHIAGQSSGEISFEDPVYDLNANAVSTVMLLDYAKKSGCQRFIYASTMSVYGQSPNKDSFSEEDETNSLSFYAVGKLASENYLKIYSALFGIKTTALRYFNVYGPGQNLANMKQGMISIYLKQFVDDQFKKIIVKGSLDRFRDFIYIEDVVNISVYIKDNQEATHDILNVGTGTKVTVSDVLNTLKTWLPCDKEIVQEPGTPGDQFGIYAKVNKLKAVYTPDLVPVNIGIKRFIDALDI